jgi:pimeloyl-ACP methyl ester carboxylesterase
MANQDIKIEPLSLRGMSGRILSAKGPAHGSQILLVYGIQSSMERMRSTAEWLADYGHVIMPDLPGLGGMDSFYSVGLEPTLDNYADYLYTFLSMRKPAKPMAVVAMSFGFLVVTRMLQKYPDSKEWIRDVISFVGFGSSADFKAYSSPLNIIVSRMFSTRFGGWFAKTFIFNPLSLRVMFAIFRKFNPKYKHAMETDATSSQAMELNLWQVNDARTRFALYVLLLSFDLTNHAEPIEVPLHDVATPSDQYFDRQRVTISLKKLYHRVGSSPANLKLHAPSIIGDKYDVDAIFSGEVKKILRGLRQV